MAKSRRESNPAVGGEPVGEITGGVDTHRDFHVAAALDSLGRLVGTAEFAATALGYAALLVWLTGFGTLARVGVEGTGDYGAGLTGHLIDQRVEVVEINRPNRQKRRREGKSDPIDAINAARAVLSGEATSVPKPRRGPVESVRVLRDVKDHLVKARTAALNTLRALVVTASTQLREPLTGLTPAQLLAACAQLDTPALPPKGLRGPARVTTRDKLAQALLDHEAATRTALSTLADTVTGYDTRIAALSTQLEVLLNRIAPRTLAQHGLGPDTTAQLLITAGTNPERLHSEAAFAKLTGVAPLEASSGQRQHHHRLSRAGDRQANSAIYRITITRLASCPRTRTYMTEHLAPNGSNKKHIIRCLKRYIAREIHPHLIADLTALTP
jgi:transposase